MHEFPDELSLHRSCLLQTAFVRRFVLLVSIESSFSFWKACDAVFSKPDVVVDRFIVFGVKRGVCSDNAYVVWGDHEFDE